MNLDAVQWLRQQVTARLEKARSLLSQNWGDRPWAVTECSRPGFAGEAADCPCIVYQGEYKPFNEPQVPPIRYIADAETPELAAWIAANDPRDAVARCEAELAILDLRESTRIVRSTLDAIMIRGRALTVTEARDHEEAGRELAVLNAVVEYVASGYRHWDGYGKHWGAA